MQSNNCPVCNSNTSKLYSLYDDRYGYPGGFDYYQCGSCDHIFLKNALPDSKLGDLYSNYYPRTNIKTENFKARPVISPIKSWLTGARASAYRWVPKGVKILDVGCGLGETVAYHEARGCDAYGIDADDNILRIKEEFKLNLKCGLFDNTSYAEEKFDLVTLDQVLEHSNDPVVMLKNVKNVLSDEGWCVITFPNGFSLMRKLFGSKWLNWHAPYHVHFYSKKSFESICQEAGFKIVKHKNITNSAWYYYQVMHWLYFPVEAKKSGFWSKDGDRRLSKLHGKICRLNNFLQRFHFYDIPARILDSLGLGDNLIYVITKK